MHHVKQKRAFLTALIVSLVDSLDPRMNSDLILLIGLLQLVLNFSHELNVLTLKMDTEVELSELYSIYHLFLGF